MAFDIKQKVENPAAEDAKRRARWAYIRPFMDAIRAERTAWEEEVSVPAA